jgi:hypothetical protein
MVVDINVMNLVVNEILPIKLESVYLTVVVGV